MAYKRKAVIEFLTCEGEKPKIHKCLKVFKSSPLGGRVCILVLVVIVVAVTAVAHSAPKQRLIIVMSIFNRFFDDRLNRVSKNRFFYDFLKFDFD